MLALRARPTTSAGLIAARSYAEQEAQEPQREVVDREGQQEQRQHRGQARRDERKYEPRPIGMRRICRMMSNEPADATRPVGHGLCQDGTLGRFRVLVERSRAAAIWILRADFTVSGSLRRPRKRQRGLSLASGTPA